MKRIEWTRAEWRNWRMDDFWVTGRHGRYGTTCGSAALAMIIDREPEQLEKFSGCNRRNPYDIADAQRTLKKFGFESYHFDGPQSLVNLGHEADWASDHLDLSHLLLFTADTTKEEASWFVGHRGCIYHNGEEFSRSPLFGLTNPMIDVLLVRRKKKR